MAGSMRKMAVYLGLVEDDDRYEEYEDDVDRSRTTRYTPSEETGGSRAMPRSYEEVAPVTQMGAAPTVRRMSAPGPVRTETQPDAYRITTLHPRTYNEARTIGEHFREGTPVIMNLTEMDDTDAKRLVDFSAGLIFGLHGTIERVTAKVFLLSPANVQVTAEDKARIAEGGFFNQS